ncbi:MAG: endo-1,4-beta-xylanase, partial [bacterium]
ESSLCFHLAAAQGQVSFRNMSVRILPEGLDPKAVSESDALVIGGDAVDRQWRQEAQQRLRENRRGELAVRVMRGGDPVRDAEVEIAQTGPLLPVGAVVPLEILAPAFEGVASRSSEAPPDLLAACRQYVLDSGLFTRILFPYAMRWSVFEQLDEEKLKTLVSKLSEEGISVHGRALYTPAFRFAPRHARQLDAENLRAAVLKHIRAQASAFAAAISEWTVIDSPLTYHEMYDVTGEDVLKTAFETAREAAPKARLFLGEDKALTSPGEERLNDFLGLVRWLRDSGAPLDGLALRVPTGRRYLAPKALGDRLVRIMEFTDLPLLVTGLDVEAPTAETQATRMEDMLLLLASYSQVKAVYFSELWAPFADRPKNALFDKNFEARPVLDTVTRLLTEEWSTLVQATTDADGIVRTEGFTATYTVTVRHNDQTVRRPCTLEKFGTEITVKLPDE